MMKSMMIAIQKPKGMTSHDVIDQLRHITGMRTIGHAGTLDPLATGVLVVGIGREATKKLHAHVRAEKEYIATIRFGATSTTDDAEGEIMTHDNNNDDDKARTVSQEDIDAALPSFLGSIQQIPPAYSAIKIRGTTAYRRARRGETLHIQPRTVVVHALDVLSYAWPDLCVRLVTGSGFYVRAFARDLGNALGVGGYLHALERTRVGDFTKDTSMTLDVFENWWRKKENYAFVSK